MRVEIVKVMQFYICFSTLNMNDERLSNSDNLPISIWSSCNSIGFVELKTNDVEASLKMSPGTFLWTPKTSTKYFLLGTRPPKVCLLRVPVHAKAVPRFESINKILCFYGKQWDFKLKISTKSLSPIFEIRSTGRKK